MYLNMLGVWDESFNFVTQYLLFFLELHTEALFSIFVSVSFTYLQLKLNVQLELNFI